MRRSGGILRGHFSCPSVGLVGLGYWGPKLLRNLLELDRVHVAAACDQDPSALARTRQRHRAVPLTERFEDLLEDPAVEAIVVATPISTHVELSRRALLAGKHVLVEKPLAERVQDAEELRGLALERGLTLMPGHTFLYSPPVVAVGEMIARGELGDLYFGTTSRVNMGLHQRDSSVVRDLAPHDFSMLLFWLGRPVFVRAIGRQAVMPGVVDVAFVDVGFPDGSIVHLDLSWLAPTKLRRTVLVGARRMIVYDDTSVEPVRIYDRRVERVEAPTFGEFQLAYRSGDIRTPHLDPAEPLRLELDDFVTAIQTGAPPRSSVDLGVDVVRMLEAAERSMADGGARVELRFPPAQPIADPASASASTPRIA